MSSDKYKSYQATLHQSGGGERDLQTDAGIKTVVSSAEETFFESVSSAEEIFLKRLTATDTQERQPIRCRAHKSRAVTSGMRQHTKLFWGLRGCDENEMNLRLQREENAKTVKKIMELEERKSERAKSAREKTTREQLLSTKEKRTEKQLRTNNRKMNAKRAAFTERPEAIPLKDFLTKYQDENEELFNKMKALGKLDFGEPRKAKAARRGSNKKKKWPKKKWSKKKQPRLMRKNP